MNNRLYDLLARSVIIQGTVTLCLVGAFIALAVQGKPVPDSLHAATMLALGFYFGSKSQQTIERMLR